MSFIARRAFSTTVRRLTVRPAIKEPEKASKSLFFGSMGSVVVGGTAAVVVGAAGYYVLTASKETEIAPWETSGDDLNTLKEAPSAINVVIVPDVNLPKSLHEKYNKYGKDGY